MEFEPKLLCEALTCWLKSELEEKGKSPTQFWREAGFEPTKEIIPGQGRGWRRLEINGRRWNARDICLIGNYFHKSPSWVLMQAEYYYEKHEINLKNIMLQREETKNEPIKEKSSKEK